MIKGRYYLKSLKLSLIGFGISCIMVLGNSVNAWKVQPIGIDSYISSVNSNYSITALKGGGLLTSYLGQGKSILAFDSNALVWWNWDGYPYVYSPHYQGYFGQYFSCDELTGTDSILQNCSAENITGDVKSLFVGFFKKVVAGDYFGYNYQDVYNTSSTSISRRYSTDVCWSSHEIGRTLCFRYGNCYSSSNLNACNSYRQGGSLVNSNNYQNLSFGNIPYSEIGYAPGQNGYDGAFEGSNGGSINGSFDNVATGDVSTMSCTWNDVLTVLETEGYNRYVCYGGLDNFDLYDSSLNYNPIAGQGLSIADIWGWSGSRAWDNFPEWFRFWNGIYRDTTDNNYNSMWESYPAVYKTYFQLYNSFKGGELDPRTVLEYCQLRLLSGNLLNNSAGGYFSPVCDTVINEKQTGVWTSRLNGTIYSGGVYTGDTPIATNWNGVGNLSGIEEQKGAVNFIQDFFNKAKSVVPTNYPGSGGGMLPSYIIIFLLALILFRFISH